MQERRIGEYLYDAGKVSEDDVKKALAIQANFPSAAHTPLLGTILVERFGLNERDLTLCLQQQERDRLGVVREPVPEQPHTDPRDGNRNIT